MEGRADFTAPQTELAEGSPLESYEAGWPGHRFFLCLLLLDLPVDVSAAGVVSDSASPSLCC